MSAFVVGGEAGGGGEAARPPVRPAVGSPALHLVVPTLEEAHGIEAFLDAVAPHLDALDARLLVVDDRSRDGTAELARRRAARSGGRIEVIERDGPRGLARSVLEGWGRDAAAPVLGVMDADLSHPPELLVDLLARVHAGADVALATRYMPGGGVEGWPLGRRVVSRAAGALARTLVDARDPLSGFMLFRREVIAGVELRPHGWKVALEVLARGRWSRLDEVPYTFRDRWRGRSKFGPRAVAQYLLHLGRLQASRAARRLG